MVPDEVEQIGAAISWRQRRHRGWAQERDVPIAALSDRAFEQAGGLAQPPLVLFTYASPRHAKIRLYG